MVTLLLAALVARRVVPGATGFAQINGDIPEPVQTRNTALVSSIPEHIVSLVFVENTDGTDGGVKRLISSMQSYGLDFYELIASNDVVLLKINCQWDERGGTNTDLIREVIQAIVDHPDGFTGEIIVADNGQAQFGPFGRGGSLSWALNNAVDTSQSVMHVVRDFQNIGHNVTGVLWDEFTTIRVQEFNEGDMRNGFVVEDYIRSTGLQVSYPKFTTEFGTMVSFRKGIWDANTGTYDGERLKVINMPVLKAHNWLQVTAAVKNYMGVPSDRLTNFGAANRPHSSVARGGMGTLMAATRMPVLNILDMIWIGPDQGPRNTFANAVRINKIAASTDPVALDWWASRTILMPESARFPGGGRSRSMNPDSNEVGTFGHWLRLSMHELHRAGITATMDESQIMVINNATN